MTEPTRKLTQDDQKKVEEYLSSPIHQVQRPPFRPLYFTFLSIGCVTGLLLLAMLVVNMAGIDT